MHSSHFSKAALAAVAFAISGSAHTWIEDMRVISSNGSFTGPSGYPRAFTKRGPGVDPDTAMVHILPPNGTPVDVGITTNDVMCFPSQQKPTQSSDSPRLKAAAGDMIALRYQENGHVTLPDTNPGKPPNRGTVYVYGTTQPSDNEKFLDVHKSWTLDGNGGNKKGKLLATLNYDDGRCYQINGGPISAARQKQFPHQADQLMGQDLWCQSDLVIPKDAPSGKPYTLYWVWDWPTKAGADPGLPKGKAQTYTTCMDVDITAEGSNAKKGAGKVSGQLNLNEAAIPDYVSKLNAGQAMLATPEQTASAAPGAAAPATLPLSSPSQPAAASQPAVTQKPQSASSPQAAGVTVTVTATPPTVTVTAGAAQATSTLVSTVPKSTVDTTASANSDSTPQGIPTISLKSVATGTASAIPQATSSAPGGNIQIVDGSATGDYKMFKRGSAKFRNV